RHKPVARAHNPHRRDTHQRRPQQTSLTRNPRVELIGAEPPASLSWDDHALLATATGRRVLTAQKRMLLGPLQERIPVLSESMVAPGLGGSACRHGIRHLSVDTGRGTAGQISSSL